MVFTLAAAAAELWVSLSPHTCGLSFPKQFRLEKTFKSSTCLFMTSTPHLSD